MKGGRREKKWKEGKEGGTVREKERGREAERKKGKILFHVSHTLLYPNSREFFPFPLFLSSPFLMA